MADSVHYGGEQLSVNGSVGSIDGSSCTTTSVDSKAGDNMFEKKSLLSMESYLKWLQSQNTVSTIGLVSGATW